MRKIIVQILISILLLFLVACGRSIENPVPSTTASYPQNATMVSTSTWHALAIMEDGGLWAWGENSDRQGILGDGTTNAQLSPVWIMDNVVYAVAGETHSLAITANGELLAWGSNNSGQLGDGTIYNRRTPVKIIEDVVHAAIAPTFSSGQIGYSTRSFAITSDNILWAWGGAIDTTEGFIGNGTTEAQLYPVRIMEDVVSFTPSYHGGFAITNCNTLWGWGYNNDGMFDDTAVQIWDWTDAPHMYAQLYPVPLMENVAKVTVHHRGSTLAITTEGTLWRLGNPHVKLMENVAYARGAYPYAIFALTTNGDLYVWGQRDELYEADWRVTPRLPLLGDGTTYNRDYPVKIMNDVDFFIIEARAAFAITTDQTLWAWGSNHPGWIGDGTGWTLEPIEGTDLFTWVGEMRLSPVPVLNNVVQISSRFADDHGSTRAISTYAVTSEGEIWAWGGCQRGFGTLGDGTWEYHLYPMRII